mmetsp:Transcript_47325/g.151073  ORF Transcript_47325/g.151073 Transcript_47325/m.151073 type:complete len:228 (+) Transcript_47325:241-924(+)
MSMRMRRKAAFSSHCGTTLMPPTTPTVTAEVRPESHVMLTWNMSTNTPPRSRKRTPAADCWPIASHQAARACPARCTSPDSRSSERASAMPALSESFSAVNSVGVTEPWSLLSGRKSSLAPERSVEMQRASTRGVRQFTSSGMAGVSMVCPACRPIMTEPTVASSAARSSRQPRRSLFRARAVATVQMRSVDCSSRCVPVGMSCRPQFVMPYFRPKSTPTGQTCRSL